MQVIVEKINMNRHILVSYIVLPLPRPIYTSFIHVRPCKVSLGL